MITFKSHEALEYIKKYLPENPIIIEAGAFDGRETIKMAKTWPKGMIHAFEPVPYIFEKLKKNTAGYPNISLYPFALSDNTGISQLYISEKPEKPGIPSQANSLLKPKERLEHSTLIFPSTLQVPTITLDEWTEKYAVEHVDFLWLDLQGYELNVLKASPKTVAQVKVIYTEVEFIEAYENQYIYSDVKKWLENINFEMVGKDFPDQPDWFFGNALFVKKISKKGTNV